MLRAIFFLLLLGIVSSCAGPADPFGSIDRYSLTPSQEGFGNYSNHSLEERASISFIPSHQVSHKVHNFKVLIEDPKGIGRHHELKIRYNDHFVDQKWLNRARKKLSEDGKSLIVDFGKLRFMPNKDNFVIVSYQREAESGVVAKEYKAPECSIGDYKVVKNPDHFKKNILTINKIERVSRMYDINPSLITALVAQESSFNPEAVSWAKAVGLTQVTTVASEQIENKTKDWPRHRGIASMSVPALKWFISQDKINKDNEWRLNETLSIQGGIEFLQYLDQYWSKKGNAELLNTVFKDQTPWTEVLLASYNSGAYNVKKGIKRKGKDWLKASHLKEARNYVGRIKSYCYVFSDF